MAVDREELFGALTKKVNRTQTNYATVHDVWENKNLQNKSQTALDEKVFLRETMESLLDKTPIELVGEQLVKRGSP